MTARTTALTALFALSTAGLAAEPAQLKPVVSPIQPPMVSPNIGRVEICTLAIEGNAKPCQTFDAHQLGILAGGTPVPRSQGPQLAFIDPVTHQLVSPTQEQLSDLLEPTISEEVISEGNEPLFTENLADGTMMVRLGNRFHVQMSAVRAENSTATQIKPEVE